MKDCDERVWVIRNGDYSVVEVNKKDIGLFAQFFETKEEAEKIAEEYKQAEKNEKKEVEELKGTMTNAEAIKTIKSIVETLDDYAFYTAEEKVAFDLAIKAIEEKRDWIPVKDKLPEEAGAYLCYGSFLDKGDNHVFIAKYDTTMEDFFWSEDGLDIYGYNVLAWQPLPEPYNPEEQNENPNRN